MSARERMMADVLRLDIDVRSGVAVVHLGEGSCTDMGGCISVVTEIDPKCKTILTLSGDDPDSLYLRGQADDWSAVDARRIVRYGRQ